MTKEKEKTSGFTLRSLSGYSATKQARAKKLLAVANSIPELQAAYLSRSNEAFRKVSIKIARMAKDENAAYQILSLLPVENQSAAMQFAADAFEEVASAKASQTQVVDVSEFDPSALMNL